MANTANSTVLTTNFNVSPYYDDYDESNQFYRILYKPGYAVQARELTQMQTIIQKQIERFGKHVFKDGSIVLPGEFTIETDLDYVKIKNNDSSNNDVAVNDYLNTTLTGATNNIKAYVVNVLDGSDTGANTKTLYIRYQSGSDVNTAIKLFQDNEVLVSNTGANPVALSSSSTGKAARFLIREGVIFAKQHFIYFPTQSIVISRYTSDANCRVGFNIDEQIITSSQDSTLLDPALEASNYAAPGADRLKLVPTLEVRAVDDPTAGPDFVELFTIQNGVVTEKYDRPVYNILQDEMAKRTFDESGDYYVRGMTVRIREDLDTGTNDGYSPTGNSQLLAIGVEPGLAYVKGYEIEKLVTDYIKVDKATTYQNATSQIGTATMGSYVIVKELSGSIVADKGAKISLYDRANNSISNRTFSATAPTGNVIGTAYVAAIEQNAGNLGTANASIALYLNDIRMLGTNSFSSVKSIFIDNGATRANVIGDLVLNTSNTAVLNDVSIDNLLIPVGSLATKTVRDSVGAPSLEFNFLRSTDITITGATGTFDLTLTTAAEGETFPYGTTSGLSDSDKNEIFLSLNQSVNIALPGTVSSNAGAGYNAYLTGSSTFFTRLNPGDKIQVAGNSQTFIIDTIISDTSLKTIQNLPIGLSGNTSFKAYKKGDLIDLTTKGVAAGAERIVSSVPNTLSFDLKEIFPTDISATVTTQVVRTNAHEVTKNLRPSRYVKINCASAVAGTTGPYSLGVSDVYRIRNIIKKSSSFPTSNTDGTDVKSQFVFNNGQKDSLYDHATITPITPLESTDRLLVEFDFFEPSYTLGKGYFTVDSYPINDNIVSDTTIRTENIPLFTSPRSKLIYDLRNYIDIRPIKAATANTSAISVAGATVNPAVSDSYNFDTNGIRLFAPSTQFSYDYSYYLPRRDLIVMDKTGFVTDIKGNPAPYPVTPTTPENTMSLASIFIPPYPSLATNYGKMVNRPDLSCVLKKMSNIRFTMRDIGQLKKRIENLEYYASLSLLEKQAVDMKILDENGLERFKNGIFVDTFSNHALGDTRNPNYRITVDPSEKTIRPFYTMNSLGYDLVANTNIVKTGDLLTMAYTEVPLLEQNKVTSYRNVELTSYRFLGSMFLTPDTDVWVDTEYGPDERITVGADAPTQNTTTTESLGVEWGNWNTTWNDWQNQVVGYEAYNSNLQLVGTYQTLADAQKPFDNDRGFIIATANTQIIPGTGTASGTQSNNYAKVTNVVVQGKFYSTYQLSRGDGLIYSVTKGGQTGVSVRTGTETFATTTTEYTETTEVVGSKLVDVSLVPYIRPQSIKIFARGMKPHTQVYPFFDNEEMSDYTRMIPQGLYENPTSPAFINTTLNAFGSDLVTDDNGDIYLELRLPATKRFRVGTKEVVLTDSLTNSIDASTKSVGYFVAHGLLQQKQNTILTTRNYSTSTTYDTRTVTDSKNVANTASGNKQFIGFVDDASCSAYSFYVKAPVGEEGVFLTSVDVFFKAKHSKFGVWFEVREMDNASGITRNQVPFSEVWLTPDQMNISDDASLATNVKFQSPIFLYADTQYAFIIHTVAINPDTYIWVGRLGETDINTGVQYTSRPLSGTFYTTNNNLNWNIVDDLDLYVKFYRADFATGTGTAVIGNKQFEQVTLSNVSSYLTSAGQTFKGRYRMTLADSGSNTASIVVGDRLIGANSGANDAVISINGSVFTVANTQYVYGEKVNIYSSLMVAKAQTATITNIDSASGVLNRYKDLGNTSMAIAEFTSSNGKFIVNDVITGIDNGNTATVTGIKNMRYAVADFEPAYLRFNNTDVDFEMQTTSNTQVLDTYISIKDNENIYFKTERAVLSRSNEVAQLGGGNSNNVRITMTSTSSYVSPVVDLARTHTIYVDNIINANTYKEDATGVTLVLSGNVANIAITDVLVGSNSTANSTVSFINGNTFTIIPTVNTKFSVGETVNIYTSNLVAKGSNTSTVTSIVYDNKKPGGLLINKYISIPITLAEGQDAEDLVVMLTSYRPPGTDVKVWVKLLHSEDSQAFDYLPWIELETEENAPYSSISSINDFIEYTYRIPASQRTGPNYEVQYKNPEGITFTGFKYYAIKIGLLGTDAAVVPRVGDLRVIAVQI